ncbi:glycogen synthase GlgA [Acetobacter fallax]|uniref:Glycogen synthase n=1 Tax=Acetobacter fallax TaxID=1737473 RepID=A0ABX0KC39_9PROT|nr:glycogen synthase GlgA [Acetobacter fallax]NHO34012.1 glycogen synthase GlgA [Acetobacter fallax]NHO37546.1 glycogen synthase GlgA [Acetobacter fallax]
MVPAASMLSRPIRLLSVASEMFPFVKTGGLGDVVASLPEALSNYGVDVKTLLPGFPAVLAAMRDTPARTLRMPDILGYEGLIWSCQIGENDLFILDIPELYDRPGNPYLGPDGCDWNDNGIRFAALARAAAFIGQGVIEGYHPDIIQTHDWQAGLTAAYLHYEGENVCLAHGMSRRPKVVQTIHNLAFHGSFSTYDRSRFGLPEEALSVDGCEFYGRISFLKAGLFFSDWITTVSPTYAEEIQGSEWGMGLDGLLRTRADCLSGILNGIDTSIWNPARDPVVRFPYIAGDVIARLSNKLAFQSEFGLPQDRNAFLLGVVSRLTRQKGIDLLPEIMGRLLKFNTQIVVVGEGDRIIHRAMSALQRKFPGRFACHLGYSEELGHRMQASVDALLIPSRFEPCGLTQLCALRYGAVPVVSRVGGLADTIVDANEAAVSRGVATGFLFSPVDPLSLAAATERARALFRSDREAWMNLQRNGAMTDVSWRGKAVQYVRLFAKLSGTEIVEQIGHNIVRLPGTERSGGKLAKHMNQKRRVARKPGVSGPSLMTRV